MLLQATCKWLLLVMVYTGGDGFVHPQFYRLLNSHTPDLTRLSHYILHPIQFWWTSNENFSAGPLQGPPEIDKHGYSWIYGPLIEIYLSRTPWEIPWYAYIGTVEYYIWTPEIYLSRTPWEISWHAWVQLNIWTPDQNLPFKEYPEKLLGDTHGCMRSWICGPLKFKISSQRTT